MLYNLCKMLIFEYFRVAKRFPVIGLHWEISPQAATHTCPVTDRKLFLILITKVQILHN